MAFPTNELSIDGKPYRIADESRLGTRRRSYIETMRPSQPSESLINTKTWRLSGPIGNSRQLALGAPLGVDYTVNLDGRNVGLLTSPPARSAVTLATDAVPEPADPASTVSRVNWDETGNANNDASDELDSYDAPNDGTYWSTDDLGAELIVGLAPQTDPDIDTDHIIQARIIAPSENVGTVGVKLRLYNSTTAIATSDEYTIEAIKTVSLRDAWSSGENTVPTHTLSGGTNRLLVCVVSGDDAIGDNFNRLTSLSYGGQAMTFYGSVETQFGSDGDRRVEVWYLLEAGLGLASGTLLVPTWTETSGAPDHGVVYSLATLENVNQTTPISGDALDKDSSSLTMSGLVVAQGDYVIAGAVNGNSHAGSWTTQAGYTEQLDAFVQDSNHHLQDKEITSDGVESVTATYSNVNDHRGAGFAIVVQGAGNGTDRAQNFEFSIPSSAVSTLASYTSLRISVVASTLTASDVVRVSALRLQLPQLAVNDVIGIDEQDGQLFVHRGDQTAQVDPGDMTEVTPAEDHGSTITDSVASWKGAGYVLFGSGVDVRKRTAVTANGATYASVTDVRASTAAVGPDRLWFVEADGGQDNWQAKFLVDEWTAAAESNGIQVADPTNNVITGLYTLGEFMIAGTQRGPRSFTDDGSPAVLGEAVEAFPSELNGAAGASLWGWHYHATKLGLYAIQPQGPIENPVGPGEGLEGQIFEGPIDGYPVAVLAFKDSLWVSYRSTEGDSWLLRGVYGPRTAATGRPEWFVFRKLTDTSCRAIGATTGRAVPAIVWAEDDKIAYSDLAFRGREIADPTYTYDVGGGEWYGTTLVLSQGLIGNVRWAKFFTENCNTSNTWQLELSADEGGFVDIGDPVRTNGLQTVRPVASNLPVTSLSFTTLKPRLMQVAASSTLPPQIRGDLVIAFDERPEHVREIDVLIELERASDLRTLQQLVGTGQATPVAVRLPSDSEVNTDRFCFVRSAEMQDRTDPTDNVALVKLIEWPLA